jgi:hypothetical protein
MRAIVLMTALLLAACASGDTPGSKMPLRAEAFCYNDQDQTARHRQQSLCMENEREITRHEYAIWAAAQIVPGSGKHVPRTASYCYAPWVRVVYLTETAGCRRDDFMIDEAEFVKFIDTKQPPASYEAWRRSTF